MSSGRSSSGSQKLHVDVDSNDKIGEIIDQPESDSKQHDCIDLETLTLGESWRGKSFRDAGTATFGNRGDPNKHVPAASGTDMLVRDLMTTEVVTVDADAPLQQAVGRMLRERVGSAILTRDGNPAGIVTETDALKAGFVSERPFTEIPVSKVASSPLVTTSEATTVRSAVRTMRDEDVKKLPVVEDVEIVGIVTMTDVVHEHEELLDEAHELERQRDKWTDKWDRWTPSEG